MMTLNEGHNNKSHRHAVMVIVLPVIFALLFVLSACTGTSDDKMEKKYYYRDNRDIVLSIKDDQYFFCGSGEEYEWIISQFGQTGPWVLIRVESNENTDIYDNQGRFYVEYKEHSVSIGRKLYISTWLEFADES